MAYIYLDLPGTTESLRTNRSETEKAIQEFWKRCKLRAHETDKRIKYITFADSLLIFRESGGRNEILNWAEEEYTWFSEKMSQEFYIIINVGEEIRPDPEHGAMEVPTDHFDDPTYANIGGLGSDFADIFTADAIIKTQRHNDTLARDLNIYLTRELIPEDRYKHPANEQVRFAGLYGEKIFYGYRSAFSRF